MGIHKKTFFVLEILESHKNVIFACFFFQYYRHKCAACYKQYKKKEHLIEHMKVSYHSVHQPKCGVCQKRCKSFESLREHLVGWLSLHIQSDIDIFVWIT